MACLFGHLKIVKYLIEQGATALEDGLYHASRGGHLEIVDYLIKHGARLPILDYITVL